MDGTAGRGSVADAARAQGVLVIVGVVLACLLGPGGPEAPAASGGVMAGAPSLASAQRPGASGTASADPARVHARIAQMPLRFEANAGRWDEHLRFVARQGGVTLLIADDAMTFVLRDARRAEGATREAGRAVGEKAVDRAATASVTLRLVGAERHAAEGEVPLATKSHFFLGNDETRWRTDVPSYARVRARGWVPGVDVVWHGTAEASNTTSRSRPAWTRAGSSSPSRAPPSSP